MDHQRRIGTISSLALLGMIAVGGNFAWGQARGGPSSPMDLMPAGTVLLISSDADALHKAAWEKTAAYAAFRESGLLDTLIKSVHDVFDQVPDPKARMALQFVEFIAEHGLTASVGLPAGDGPALPYLTFVAHDAGNQANFLTQTLGQNANPKRQKLSGRLVSVVKIPEYPQVELSWWTEGKHLVLTVGVGATEMAIAVADGKSPNLSATAAGKKLLAKPAFERTALAWLNASLLRERFGPTPLPSKNDKTVADVLEAMGLNSLNSVLVQTGYKDAALWTTLDIDSPGPRKGLLGFADPKSTFTLKDLPPLPAGCIGFSAQSLSLMGVYDNLLESAREMAKLGPPQSPEQLEELLDQMPEFLGFDLRADLLFPLGPIQCFYSDATQGLLFADFGLFLQVSDGEKLRETFEIILQRLSQQVPEEAISAIQHHKHGKELITLQIAGGAFNPSILIEDDWMCIGLTPQTIESLILRRKGDLPVWTADKETADAFAQGPKKFSSISVDYPRLSMRGVVAAAPTFLGIVQAGIAQLSRFGAAPPIDLAATAIDLPPAEVVIAPLFPNVSWTVIDDAGVHLTNRCSAPSIPLLSGPDGGSIAMSGLLVSSLMPNPGPARDAARRTQSRNNLKQFGLALHNFHDVYTHFPQGTIPSKTLKPEERQSWMVQILPYVDESPLYNQMQVNMQESAQWDSDSLALMNRKSIHIFLNPSQLRARDPEQPSPTDYAGWAGVGKDAPTEKAKADKKGIFGYDRKTRIADISDGTSNTFMVSEVVEKGSGPWAQGGSATIRALTAKPYVNGVDGIGGQKAGFQALHADGSVRFVSEKVDAAVLEALATRAGGEVVGDY